MATTTKTRGGNAAPVWGLIALADEYVATLASIEDNDGELSDVEAEFLAALPDDLSEKVEGFRLAIEGLSRLSQTNKDLSDYYKQRSASKSGQVDRLRSILFAILDRIGEDVVKTPSGHTVRVNRPDRLTFAWFGDPADAPEELQPDPKPPTVSSSKLAAYVAEVESTGVDRLGVMSRIESAPVAAFLSIR